LKRGPLSLNDSLLIARQVAEALEVAHENGVVHRDLKPANVQLTPEGQAKVLDFGLAKAAESRAGDSAVAAMSPTVTSLGTMAGTILGTAAYMSPEQARGKGVDSRADIWAFGCLLFEMLTGKQLFRGETVTDLLGAIMHRELVLDELPTEVPPSVHRLLGRCLQRDPRQRLRDIGDARIIIEEALSGKADAEPRAGTATAPRPKGGRLAILAATAVLAAGLGAVAVWLAGPVPAKLPLRKFDIPMSSADRSSSIYFDPEISPDGKHLVYVSRNQLWVRDLDKVASFPLAGTEGATDPFWSPDSEWIGFARGRSIEKVARSGGEPTLVAATTAQTQLAGARATWGEDGRIVWTSGMVGLLQVSAQGGDMATLEDPGEGESDFHELCRLPEGKGLVFVVHESGGDFGKLSLLTPDGQRRDVVAFDSGNVWDPFYSPSGHLVFGRSGAVPGIWALPFSISSLEATDDPFLVAADGATRWKTCIRSLRCRPTGPGSWSPARPARAATFGCTTPRRACAGRLPSRSCGTTSPTGSRARSKCCRTASARSCCT
jgi:serine/threonine-protein kinase